MPGEAQDEWEGKELVVDNITKGCWISVRVCRCRALRCVRGVA